MKKKIIITLLAALLGTSTSLANPARAMTAHELAESYIASQEEPVLMDTTAYIHGDICSHGDKPREGIAAVAPEWYGAAAVVYEAVPDGMGGYDVGDLIVTLECLDTGYGYSTGDGVRSKVRPDKSSRGSIETGKHIDVYRDGMKRAKEWMERTGGKVYVQIIREVKG